MSDEYYRYDYQPSEYIYDTGELYVRTFVVIKHTPKGVWVIPKGGYGRKRFILNTARKRFAYNCKAHALESCIARKKRAIVIHQWHIDMAKGALLLAEKLKAQEVQS